MKKLIYGLLVVGAGLFVGAQAHALSVSTGLTGNTQVGSSATGSSAMDGATGTAQASGTAAVQMNVGLQAEIQSGTVVSSSDDAVVQLQGNTLGLIQTSDDLTAYNNLVVKARPAVSSIKVATDGSMNIGYSQPAKFLGIFKTSLAGNVNVDASGNVNVSTPWYGFLYTKDTTPVQASVTTAIQQSGAQLNAQATTQAQLQNQAMLVNAITAAIQTEAQASATASVSAQ
jgi:hypothetical protein